MPRLSRHPGDVVGGWLLIPIAAVVFWPAAIGIFLWLHSQDLCRLIAFLIRGYFRLLLFPIRFLVGRIRGWHDGRKLRLRERDRLRDEESRMVQQERAARAAEARREIQLKATHRREDARAACEMLYALHAPEIATRFPKASLDEFLAKYMGDDRDPEYVEQRSEQLQAIIRQHLEMVRPSPKFTSIEDVAHWFADQRRKIEGLPVEDRTKKMHLAELNERYAELTSKLLEGQLP